MKYKTIVIDFPWNVKSNFTKKGYGKTLPYQTMTDEQIISFNIDEFADDNCDLFLWTTHTKLLKAFDYLFTWAFKYHSLITWDKGNGIVINGIHRKTELCLYAYRGKLVIKQTKSIPTLIKEDLTTHSTKP
jgi:N6-adenosine-specific RNA methylase IME4